jgi:hypothetical protein
LALSVFFAPAGAAPNNRPSGTARHGAYVQSELDLFKSVSKARKNCAPFAPKMSVYAHNSIEFVPPCTSKIPENTAFRTTPAKLIPRLSSRFCDVAGRRRPVAIWLVAAGGPATKQHRRARDQKAQSRAYTKADLPRLNPEP